MNHTRADSARRLSLSAIRLTTVSMSSNRFVAPKLNLIDASASSVDRPMAFNTYDGAEVPEVHADPVDAAIAG